MPLNLPPHRSRARYAARRNRDPDATPQSLGLTLPGEIAAFHEAGAEPYILRHRDSPNLHLVEIVRPEPEYRPTIYDHTLVSALATLRRTRGGPGDGSESWSIILRCGPAAAKNWQSEPPALQDIITGRQSPEQDQHPYHFLTLPWNINQQQRLTDGLRRLVDRHPDIFSVNNPGLTPADKTAILNIITA